MNLLDRVVALSQLFVVGAWALLGSLAFGWPPLIVVITGLLGIGSFNVLTATAVRTFFKLIEPSAAPDNVVNINDAPSITEEDGVA